MVWYGWCLRDWSPFSCPDGSSRGKRGLGGCAGWCPCENISSVEVEGTLLRHPAVQEVAIVGLPHEKWGETPHAFVVLRDGGSATEEEIIAFARERLAHFKAPRGVTFTGELPKTATGKIQKYVLRKGAPNLSRQ